MLSYILHKETRETGLLHSRMRVLYCKYQQKISNTVNCVKSILFLTINPSNLCKNVFDQRNIWLKALTSIFYRKMWLSTGYEKNKWCFPKRVKILWILILSKLRSLETVKCSSFGVFANSRAFFKSLKPFLVTKVFPEEFITVCFFVNSPSFSGW